MNKLYYTEEQIMIRAMPCPDCFAKPREHCKRKPRQNGLIRNHQDRQILFHEFIKSAKNYGAVDLHGHNSWAVTEREFKERQWLNNEPDEQTAFRT